MRFNHAPTRGYEVDVGSKTSIRVVNSQVSCIRSTHTQFGLKLVACIYVLPSVHFAVLSMA